MAFAITLVVVKVGTGVIVSPTFVTTFVIVIVAGTVTVPADAVQAQAWRSPPTLMLELLEDVVEVVRFKYNGVDVLVVMEA